LSPVLTILSGIVCHCGKRRSAKPAPQGNRLFQLDIAHYV
jgi:hypothetical protein